MQTMINIFNSLSAPYLLYSGSLLNLYRNCSIGNSDIDFSLELDWWKDNKDVLDNALVGAGFSHILTFGSINDTWAYEEAWSKDGWKVDIFSSIMVGNIHKIGFWVGENLYPCTFPLETVGVYKWRESVKVRVPVPMEDAVIAMFGKNWEQPAKSWDWGVDPFLTGFCTYTDTT